METRNLDTYFVRVVILNYNGSILYKYFYSQERSEKRNIYYKF